MIRQATDSEIIDFLFSCYEEMKFSDNGLSFDASSVLGTINMANDKGGCFFVDRGDQINGIFAAMLVPNIMDYGQLRAVEYIWHTNPCLSTRNRIKSMERLLMAACEWSSLKNVCLVINASENKPAAKKILERNGLVKIEESYLKGNGNGY